jgi:hypothetical protein
MQQQPKLRRTAAALALGLALAVPVSGTQATMIGTDAALGAAQASAARSQVGAALARAEVQQALRAQGVDPAEAQARLSALSDAEVQRIAARVDELPAGGFGVLGAIAVVAIIFVITDAMGLTNVYNFVVPQR